MREGQIRTCGERLARQESVCTSQGDNKKYIFKYISKDFLKNIEKYNVLISYTLYK